MTDQSIDILLIDDDAVDRSAIIRFIRDQRLPYTVTAAGSLNEARAILARTQFAVIFSDYMLGEGTGLDVLQEAGGIPVIFITGHGDESIAALALRQGAYDYIIKDADRHYLTALPGAVNNTLMRRRAERAVAESEKRNRELLENLPNGVYQTTPDGEILYANPALIRMLGYDSFEALAQVRLDGQNYHPRYPRQSFIDRMRSDGRVVGLESEWRTKGGRPLFVRESATAVTAQDGSILYFEGLVEDMTERRQAEEKEKHYLRELSFLYETSSLLNSLDTIDSMYQYLSEVIRELTGDLPLIICRYFPEDQTIRIHSARGFEQPGNAIAGLIGFELQALSIPVGALPDADLQAFTSGRLIRVEGGIYELSARRLPPDACAALERLLNVAEIHAMGFSLQGRLYGGMIVLLHPGDALDNRSLIETIINQGAMAIQRKMAEEQLRQSEEFSRTVIEHSPVGITIRDRTGKLLSYNAAWMRICKMREEDIPRVRQVNMESILKSYASWGVASGRVAEIFQNGGNLAFPELRVVDNDDGSFAWLSQQIYGIIGPDGAVDRVVTLTEDVSERKRADEDIRNKEEYYHSLIKNSSDIITILNPDQTVRYASPSVKTVLGFRPEEVIGRRLRSMLHPDDIPLIRKTFRENAALSGVLAPIECRIRHADGSWRTLEHIAQNLIADQVIRGVIVNSRDVTERRQSDALRNTLYRLSELTAAAHDSYEFYAGVHRIVADLMYARNFFICLFDQASQQLTYPYFVDEFDLPPQSRRMGRGLTDYIIRHGQPLLAFREHMKKLMDESAVNIQGCLPTALLAVPLKAANVTIGALVVQSYTPSMFFAERDKEILTYVSQEVAVALERKHSQDALRKSEADLRAVFNNTSQVFILIDSHQKIRSFNTKAAEWSRIYGRREMKENDILYYYLVPELTDDFTLYINAAKKGRSFATELPFQRDGERHWFETVFNPVYDDAGQVYGVSLTMMNIDDRKKAVADLSRSEERFRAMVQNSSDNIIVIDAAGSITYQSPSVERVLGYRPDSLVGTNAFDLIHHEDRSRVMDLIQAQLGQPGVIKQIEYRARRADGSWVHLESVGNNLLNDPAVRGIVINARDISERKQAEKLQTALYRIEEITNTAGDLSDFFAAVHQVIKELVDTPNFFIALYNPDTRQVSFPYFIDEKDAPPQPRTIANALTDYIIMTGEPLYLSHDRWQQLEQDKGIKTIGTPSNDLLGVPLKSGDQVIGAIVVQSYSGNLLLGERALEILNFISRNIATAIERRRSQESLMRLGLAIENMDESVVIADRNGDIQYVNPAFTAVTGYDRSEVIGRNPRLWHSGKHDPQFYREMWAQLLQGRTWQGNLVNRKKDGSLYQEEVTISPVKGGGETINYVAIKRDVTEKRRLQAIAEAANTMNNIGYVFSGIRHEIGNALNSMKMATSIVQKNLDSWTAESLKKFVDMAMSEVGRMEDLLRSLKNFSMYEAPKFQVIDIPGFFKKLVLLVSGDFKSRGIQVQLMIEPGVDRAWADPHALHQVMLNLLSNAADALAEKDRKAITISVSRHGGLVRIAIRDNGCGMSPEQLANLFKPFYTSKPSGSGLGLVITKNILARMNSTIEFDSRLDQGTEAVIAVPETAGGAVA